MNKVDVLAEALRDFSLLIGEGEAEMTTREEGPFRLAFGTVVRAAPIDDGGELVLLNWEDKTVEAKVPIRPRNPTIEEDPKLKGNARGCRGIRWHEDRLLAASYHTLELYDDALNQIGEINDGLMVGLHEIDVTEESTVWVTSTAIDAALEYDLETGDRVAAQWPREMLSLQDALGLSPMEIDKHADQRLAHLTPTDADSDSHLHLNAVDVHDGSVYGLSNEYGALINFTDETIAVRDEGLRESHNLVIRDDGCALVNDTIGRAVRFYDLGSGARVKSIDLVQYEWVRRLVREKIPPYWGRLVLKKLGRVKGTVARPLFVRGLVSYGDYIFVGVSPASILQINWQTEELVDAYRYSDDVSECIHGLDAID